MSDDRCIALARVLGKQPEEVIKTLDDTYVVSPSTKYDYPSIEEANQDIEQLIKTLSKIEPADPGHVTIAEIESNLYNARDVHLLRLVLGLPEKASAWHKHIYRQLWLGGPIDLSLRGYSEENQGEYIVMTSAVSNASALEEIKDNIWTLNALYLAQELGISISTIEHIQDLGVAGNRDFIAILGDRLEDFCKQALVDNGRGDFLANVDGIELVITYGQKWYIYRIE